MTSSSNEKVLKQIGSKKAKLVRWKKYNVPKDRTKSKNVKKCRRCGNRHAVISKYGLDLCRRCFREIAEKIGFDKYN